LPLRHVNAAATGSPAEVPRQLEAHSRRNGNLKRSGNR